MLPLMKEFPLGIVYRRKGLKSSDDGATRWSKKFLDRFSRLDIIPGVTDGRTDRRTRCSSKDNAMLCVARVKINFDQLNVCSWCIT